MKVIFLPNNTSSLVSRHVPALRQQGVEAVGYNFAPLKINDTEFVNNWPREGKFLKLKKVKFLFHFVSDLLSSDVIHWMYAGNSRLTKIALLFIRLLSKKKFVELSGTDIRSLEKLCEDVPFFNFDKFSDNFKRQMGTESSSLETHSRFSKAGFIPIPSYPELIDYIRPEFFPKYHLISRVVDLQRLTPFKSQNTKPLIVHAPSNPEIKGTEYINKAAERLVAEGLADYRLVTGLSHSEAMELLRNSDIIVDQLMVGEYGVLAIEGMALEKTVVCFIRPKVLKYYEEHFEGFPIVNANIQNIYEVLKDLCLSNEKRQSYSSLARVFAERYHDRDKNASRLIEIYKS